MEYKSVELELTDLNKESRTAIIAHAVYNNIDRTRDISRKGMFNKSWQESKSDIGFYYNHDPKKKPGKVIDVFEDENKAYTKVKCGNHTLGNDTLIMMDDGLLKDASFGYVTLQHKTLDIKGQKIRELREVKHIETSILDDLPANPEAGVVRVYKSLTTVEVKALEDKLTTMEKFVRNTKASDECILSVLKQIAEIKSLISNFDTDSTLVQEPDSSRENELLVLKNINNLFKQPESWQTNLKINLTNLEKT